MKWLKSTGMDVVYFVFGIGGHRATTQVGWGKKALAGPDGAVDSDILAPSILKERIWHSRISRGGLPPSGRSFFPLASANSDILAAQRRNQWDD